MIATDTRNAKRYFGSTDSIKESPPKKATKKHGSCLQVKSFISFYKQKVFPLLVSTMVDVLEQSQNIGQRIKSVKVENIEVEVKNFDS